MKMKNVPVNAGWQQSRAEVFWREIKPTDHVLQVYEKDSYFIDALAGFVGGGINAGDCCVVIATTKHLEELHDRLKRHVVRVDTLIADNRYMPLNVEEVLAQFMMKGLPDKVFFEKTISNIIRKAKGTKRRIRAFGELVALLWEQGNRKAVLEIDRLWNLFCEKDKLSLFRAYPKSGFAEDINVVLNEISGPHSKLIAGSESQSTNIKYRNIEKK